MDNALLTEVVPENAMRDTLEQAGLAGVDLLALMSRFDPVGAWRQVLSTGHSFWTPGLYAIFGMPQSSAPANLVMAIDRYHEDDRDIVVSLWEESLRLRAPFSFTARIRVGAEYRVISCVAEHRNSYLPDEEVYGIVWLTPGAQLQARIGR